MRLIIISLPGYLLLNVCAMHLVQKQYLPDLSKQINQIEKWNSISKTNLFSSR